MKPVFPYNAYIQMLRYGSDGPFMRGNKAEYALLVHCTDLTSRNESLCEDNNRLRSSLEASVNQIMSEATESGRLIRAWKVAFWGAMGGLGVAVFFLLSSGGVR
jgi:hypothetical protein